MWLNVHVVLLAMLHTLLFLAPTKGDCNNRPNLVVWYAFEGRDGKDSSGNNYTAVNSGCKFSSSTAPSLTSSRFSLQIKDSCEMDCLALLPGLKGLTEGSVSVWVKKDTPPNQTPVRYNFTQNYVNGPTASNPQGQWTYVQFNPSSRTAMPLLNLVQVNHYANVDFLNGEWGWLATNDPSYGFPGVGKYWFHPQNPPAANGFTNAMTYFTAPSSGYYSIYASAARADPTPLGDGVTVILWHNFVPVANLSIPVNSTPGKFSSLSWAGVISRFDTLAVSVDPNQGYEFDLTFFSVQVAANVLDGTIISVWNSYTGAFDALWFKQGQAEHTVYDPQFTPRQTVTSSSALVTDSAWHNLVLSVSADPPAMWLYLDGVEVEGWADSAGPRSIAFFRDAVGLDNCVFGRGNPQSQTPPPPPVLIDDYTVWDQPLSKKQVAKIFAGVAPNLIA